MYSYFLVTMKCVIVIFDTFSVTMKYIICILIAFEATILYVIYILDTHYVFCIGNNFLNFECIVSSTYVKVIKMWQIVIYFEYRVNFSLTYFKDTVIKVYIEKSIETYTCLF